MLKMLRVAPLIWPFFRLVWRLLRDRRVPTVLKLLPLMAALYVVSPFDVIPDILPGFGQLDDLVVAAALLLAFIVLSPWRVVGEHLAGRAAPPSKTPPPTGDGPVIDADHRYVEK